jgi:hypothetical protein
LLHPPIRRTCFRLFVAETTATAAWMRAWAAARPLCPASLGAVAVAALPPSPGLHSQRCSRERWPAAYLLCDCHTSFVFVVVFAWASHSSGNSRICS